MTNINNYEKGKAFLKQRNQTKEQVQPATLQEWKEKIDAAVGTYTTKLTWSIAESVYDKVVEPLLLQLQAAQHRRWVKASERTPDNEGYLYPVKWANMLTTAYYEEGVWRRSHDHCRIVASGIEWLEEAIAQAAQPPVAEAVAFAEWVMNNQFKMYNGVWTSTKIHYSPDQYSTEQLYQLFLATTKPEGGNQ